MPLEILLLGEEIARHFCLAGRELLECQRHEGHALCAPIFMFVAPALSLADDKSGQEA